MRENLSEICGLHAGDGYLRNDGRRIELDISGNIEEKEFYDNHVIPLFCEYFNIKIKGRYFFPRNTYGFVIRDRKIVEFMHSLKFPYGNKTLSVRAPGFIFDSKENMTRFLRGLFDTDGCFCPDRRRSYGYCLSKRKYHYYPRISITTCSSKLFKHVCKMLGILNIRFNMQIYKPKKTTENIKYIVWVVGVSGVERWMSIIGSKNPVKVSRYTIWKKYGFCPPRLTYKERKQILKGKINPKIYYGPVAQPG